MAGKTRSPAPLLPLVSWHELESTPEPGVLEAAAGGARRRECRRDPARLPRPLRRLRRLARVGVAGRWHARVPLVPAAVLPAAGRTGDRAGGPPARAGAALLAGRPHPGRRMTLVRELRRRTTARPAPPVERCDLCGSTVAAGPPAPPAPGRAPDPVRLRELLRAALGRSRAATDRAHGSSGSTDFSLPEEVWAGFRIPIGLAFLFRSSVTGGMVAFYPSPAGATESELELDAWDGAGRANPLLETLEPDVEAPDRQPSRRAAAVRDRADRPLLRARRAREAALGGNQRRDAPERGDRRLLRGAARGRA